MTIDQETSAPVHCPRCGGLMYKPAGSSFYWHADNNHPPCEITNLPDSGISHSVSSIINTDEAPTEALQGQGKKKSP